MGYRGRRGGRETRKGASSTPPRHTGRARARVGERLFDRRREEGRKEGIGMEGKGCRDGDKRAATEKTVQAARAQVRSPVSAWLYRVCRVPSICRDCRDARWRDLKARLHHVGQSDVSRRVASSSPPPSPSPSPSPRIVSYRLVSPRVSVVTKMTIHTTMTTMTTTTTANGQRRVVW